MQATIQIKMSLEKAQQLKNRLAELTKTARDKRIEIERKLAKNKDDTKLRQLYETALELEADMTMTNLLRALIDFGMEKLLGAPDQSLIALLHAVKRPVGRPPRDSIDGEVIK